MKLLTGIRQIIHAASAPRLRQSALEQVVRPDARNRWLFAGVSNYTPDLIETTLRGALSGNLQATWQLYDLMEATWPRLSKNLKELKDAVVSADWSVQPWTQRGMAPTPEATRRAQMLEAAIWSMSPSATRDETEFRGLMFDVLDAWGKGISLVEILWEQRDLRGFGQAITPRSGLHVWPRYYGYPQDSAELMLNGRELESAGAARKADGWLPIQAEKFLVAVAKQKSGHPAGSSLLRPLAWWWCAANFSAQWFLNFAQIFGLPIRWAQYDPNQPGLLQQICDMLENMGSSGWGAFPAGTTLELKEPARGSTGSLPQEAVIDRADRNCDILILGQTLTTDVGDSGSRALGSVHEDVLGGRKRAAADWLAGVLTQQLAPAFCRLNWGNDDDCPQFVVGSEAAEDPLVMAQRDEILLRSGIQLPREWFYGRHDIPIPAEGEPVIQQSQPAALPGWGGGMPKMPQDAFSGAGDIEPGAANHLPAAGYSSTAQAGLVNAQAAIEPEEAVSAIVRRAVADAAGVRERWLAPLQEELDHLVAVVRDGTLSDQEVAAFVDAAARNLPDLFSQLDVNALADSLSDAMEAAAVAAVTQK